MNAVKIVVWKRDLTKHLIALFTFFVATEGGFAFME